MAELRMDDPELYKLMHVDGEGRIYLGKEFADTDVKIAIELVEDGN